MSDILPPSSDRVPPPLLESNSKDKFSFVHKLGLDSPCPLLILGDVLFPPEVSRSPIPDVVISAWTNDDDARGEEIS